MGAFTRTAAQEEFEHQPPVQSEIKKVTSPVDGYLYAEPGTIVVDDDGRYWQKRTVSTVKTGWAKLIGNLVYDTTAALTASTVHADHDIAWVLGTLDGQTVDGSVWAYLADSTLAAGTYVIQPTDVAVGSAGRWVRLDDFWYE